ncbi:MAG: transcriptional regulator, partial [Myxococcota bacterium]
LGERVDAPDARASLHELETNDLYLACACGAGVPQAIETLETHYRALVGAIARRKAGPGVDEVSLRDHLRRHLFVARPQAPAAITQYSGRGPLGAWLRVTATRAAIGLRREAERERSGRSVEESLGRQLLSAASVAADPELEILLRTCQDVLREALQGSAQELEPRQRTLLRLSLSDRHSVRQLGAMYGVHHATAARWLRDAHAALIDGVRARLGERLGVQSRELLSLMRAVRSRLDLTLSGALGDADE